MTFFDIDQGFNGAGIEEVRIDVGPSGSVNKTTLEKPPRYCHQKTSFEQPGSEKRGFFTNSRHKRCLQQCLV